jgi:rhamnosyltransferase
MPTFIERVPSVLNSELFMLNTMPLTSILLLTKNDASSVASCLGAIYSQESRDPFEVIAIDSGSTDGTIDVLRRFPLQLQQIPPESFHHARTRNLAAGYATGDVIVFLSQDAIPASSTWLQTLLCNFDDPGVGAVYGRQLPRQGSSVERQDALNALYGTRKIVKDPAARNDFGYLFYHFSNVNSAMRRSVWSSAQFPEHLKVFEDLGIAKRVLDAGWKIVYEPEAPVFHSHTHSTAGLFKRYFDIGYSLKLLEIWDAPGTRKSMLRDVAKLLRRKLDRLRSNKGSNGHDGKLLGHGICQDIVKSTGLFLGLNQACLPLFLKRHLSAYGVFD